MLAEAQRLSMLRAMGIDVFQLRAMAAQASATDPAGGDATVAIVCLKEATALRFKAQLPRALGIAEDHLQWCDVGAPVPGDAGAYVVIGTEAARALGAQLSTMQQNRSLIATTAEPSDLLRGGAAKRALWQVLKPIARRVRERN